MEIFRTLGALAEPPRPELGSLAVLLDLGPLPPPEEHVDLFDFQLYPFASVYLGEEGMLGGEARDLVAGFWRALGQEPPAEPDHLAVMLAFYAALASASHERLRRARHAFLWEHLMSWLPAFLEALRGLSGAPAFYRRWAALLTEALAAESRSLGPPASLPLALRRAPPLPDPRRGDPKAFPRALLAPVRSGMVLVRDDLRRAAAELGLGGRAGERTYVLEALLSQDAAGTLGWLRGEALRWSARHRGSVAGGTPVGEVWAERAEKAAALLGELAENARSME